MRYALTFPAIRIERRFADAILEGRKVWEFRSDNRALLESLQAEVRDKVSSLRVSRLDMLDVRLLSRRALAAGN